MVIRQPHGHKEKNRNILVTGKTASMSVLATGDQFDRQLDSWPNNFAHTLQLLHFHLCQSA